MSKFWIDLIVAEQAQEMRSILTAASKKSALVDKVIGLRKAHLGPGAIGAQILKTMSEQAALMLQPRVKARLGFDGKMQQIASRIISDAIRKGPLFGTMQRDADFFVIMLIVEHIDTGAELE
ncbi:hypothetical protein DW2_12400 [Thioclava atlantica]|uniref:Uncharacterized protein n=1 Tax=Thioclava atlantica TaxID=1317124 RepID=A0A085TVA6_9RHOB|nr:hypothetical protein DW2_12400 [Thioclava atlantica]